MLVSASVDAANPRGAGAPQPPASPSPEPLEDDDACRRERSDLVEECAALPGVGSVRHVEGDGLVVEPDLVVSVAGLQPPNKMGGFDPFEFNVF